MNELEVVLVFRGPKGKWADFATVQWHELENVESLQGELDHHLKNLFRRWKVWYITPKAEKETLWQKAKRLKGKFVRR